MHTFFPFIENQAMLHSTCAQIVSLATLFFLYAETHYSFKGIYSRLKKKEPEIIADVPFRIEQGVSLPVLIFIKDAHLHPLLLRHASITLKTENGQTTYQHAFNDQTINVQFWHHIIEITPEKELTGLVEVDVRITVVCHKKRLVVKNDNYACTSHQPFTVYFAERQLPKTPNWFFGDVHCHSQYTSDQVEFGAPLAAGKKFAKALGLSFFCATDHSYDLDDETDNYLKNDPQLKKWIFFQKEVSELNGESSDFIIIPGEEVSIGNAEKANVHLLVLNHPEFIPGAGDSAEKWFRTKPTLQIPQVLNKLNGTSVSIAAHPELKPPLLERLFVGRGKWKNQDYQHASLDSMQVWNGSEDGLFAGIECWKKLLLNGNRLFITGGNDAHGNFNRFRQIGFPFFTMTEHHRHLFGKVRTAVYLKDTFSLNSILQAIHNGNMVITDGPFVELRVTNEHGLEAVTGESLAGNDFLLTAKFMSTEEFGPLTEATLFLGDLQKKTEQTFRTWKNFASAFEYTETVQLQKPALSYLRVELTTGKGKNTFRCFTNPIWLKREVPHKLLT